MMADVGRRGLLDQERRLARELAIARFRTSRSLRRQRRVLVIALTAITVVVVTLGPRSEWWTGIAGLVMLWASAFPLWWYLRRQGSAHIFPAVYTGVYFLAYGLPAFMAEASVVGRPLSRSVTLQAAAIAAGAELVFLGAYYGIGARISRRVPALALEFPTRASLRLTIAAIIFTALSALPFIAPLPSSIAQLGTIANYLDVVTLGGLLLLLLRGESSVVSKLVLVGASCVLLCLQLGTGLLATPALTLVALAFVYMRLRRTIPWKLIGCFVCLFVPLQLVKGEFRRETWNASAQVDPMRLGVMFLSLPARLLDAPHGVLSAQAEAAQSRLDHLGTLAWVIESTPSVVPYWDGATYAGAAWMFLPRLLFPEKPEQKYGQEFGHRYRLLDPTDHTTSYNFEQLVEFYANFGLAGPFLGMALLGAMYRILVGWLSTDGAADCSVVLSAPVLAGLLNLESNFVVVHGLVIQSALIAYGYMRLLGARRADFASMNQSRAGRIARGRNRAPRGMP